MLLKLPPREAAGTGHLCTVQPACSAGSGMQSPRKQGYSTSWLQLGSALLTPLLSRLQSFTGIKHLPDHGSHSGTGGCLPGQVPGLGKTGMLMEQHQGEERGSEHLWVLLWQRCPDFREEPAVSPQSLEGKQKLQLQISSKASCSFTSAWLTSFHPMAVTAFGGGDTRSEKQPGVGYPLFSALRLSLFLTPCLQPDVLTASLLPAFAFTLVFIQQCNSGS